MPTVEDVIRQFTDDWPKNRPLIEQLASMGTSAVPALLAALQSTNGYVRCGVAEALGRIGDTRAYDALVAALKNAGEGEDEDSEAQIQAANALGRLGDRRAIMPLMSVLSQALDGSGNVAPFLIDALAKLGAADAVATLRGLRSHWNQDVRTSVEKALLILVKDPGDSRA